MEQYSIWECARIKDLKSAIQQYQSSPQDQEVINEEKTAQSEQELLHKREEILWRDKAKARWIDEGDANTRFFHLSTIINQRYNTILAIVNSNNSWSRFRNKIGTEFQQFFNDSFDSTEPHFPSGIHNLFRQVISPAMNDMLMELPSQMEIQRVIFSMGNHKSPDPDSMTVLFYEIYWHIVKDVVCLEVRNFFASAKLKLVVAIHFLH